MTKAEIKRVKQYLHSIKATEIAIFDLNRAIENHIGKRDAGMRITASMSLAPGGDGGSKVEAFAEFLVTYPERLRDLYFFLDEQLEKLNEYTFVMDAMANERHWGPLAVEIVRHKYYEHIRPDTYICTRFLYCTPETFYRTHRRVLQFFYDVLPHRFKK